MRRGSTFWGAILLLVGTLLLLENLGILSINVWQLFWPIAIIIFGVWFIWRSSTAPKSRQVDSFELPLEGSDRLNLTVHYGAGRLRIGGDCSSSMALEGTFEGGLDRDVNRRGADLDVDLRVPTDDVLDMIPWGTHSGLNWDLKLSDAVEVDLTVDAGASENTLDLAGLNVSNLTFKTGASDTRIHFSDRAEHAQAHLGLGAASAKLTIPENVSASIEVKSGLTEIRVDQDRFPRSGDVYQSADFGSASHRLTLHVEAGVGSVEIM